VATLFLMVGLPAAAKTTRARELATQHRALRLSPDAWMISLFGESEADGRRDVLEGRLIWVGLEALRLGANVALDFGFWARGERSALRWLARSVGGSCRVVYLPGDRASRLSRIFRRRAATPDQTFPMSEADVDQWRQMFEVPDAAELDDAELPDPSCFAVF
jgi:predicted kinase